jgi:hypothetical protein
LTSTYASTAALHADGSITVWGSNAQGQISLVPQGTTFRTLGAGDNHFLAIGESDCNGNGVSDYIDIGDGTSADCNSNGVPDSCELANDPYADIDADGQLDDCGLPAFVADQYELSLSEGGVQTFTLNAPFATDLYLILGTTHGPTPGIPVGGFVLPLTYDAYLSYTLINPNVPPLSGSFGVLPPSPVSSGGQTTATYSMPAAFDPTLAGVVLHHAYVTISIVTGDITSVSNAVPTKLIP